MVLPVPACRCWHGLWFRKRLGAACISTIRFHQWLCTALSMVLSASIMVFGVIFLEKMLWQLCREAKEASHLTNQAIADRAGLALNTVSQYLRGESKSASVYTVGQICYALGIDMNAYFGISPPAPESVSELLRLENKSLRTQRDQLRKSLKMHRITTFILLGIISICVLALLIDVLNPSIGWIRA